MSYKLKLDLFEGPLDLLLYLIKKNDIDINDIPICEITDQYLEYIDMMKMLDLEIVGDFLVMAATLMHIKSKMLLPPDPTEEEEQEDPRDELTQKLLEYQAIKQAADLLQEKETDRKNYFNRQIDEETTKNLIKDSRETFFEANLFDLINALSEALRRKPGEITHDIVQEEYTVEDKIHSLKDSIQREKMINVTQLFERAKTKAEVIVTFLAILELTRLQQIKVVQKRNFADIEIVQNPEAVTPAV